MNTAVLPYLSRRMRRLVRRKAVRDIFLIIQPGFVRAAPAAAGKIMPVIISRLLLSMTISVSVEPLSFPAKCLFLVSFYDAARAECSPQIPGMFLRKYCQLAKG